MRLPLLIQLSGFLSMAFFLNGCGLSFVADRKDNPSIQDAFAHTTIWSYLKFKRSSVNTFSPTASRRSIIVKSDGDDKFETCAEPPPDVGESFASAISEGLKIAASEPKTQVQVDVASQYAKAVATQISPLVYRTQGLQFYRDSLHDLCIDHLNGWIDDAGMYRMIKWELREKAAALISEELKSMANSQAIFYQHVKTGIAVDDLQKLHKSLNTAGAPGDAGSQTSGSSKEKSNSENSKENNKEKSKPSDTRNGR